MKLHELTYTEGSRKDRKRIGRGHGSGQGKTADVYKRQALYNQQGAQVGEIVLNEAIFGIEPHKQAMFDAVIMQRASMRQGTHKTKTRTEVRGGGRKPWKQKGTGRARQGSVSYTHLDVYKRQRYTRSRRLHSRS